MLTVLQPNSQNILTIMTRPAMVLMLGLLAACGSTSDPVNGGEGRDELPKSKCACEKMTIGHPGPLDQREYLRRELAIG